MRKYYFDLQVVDSVTDELGAELPDEASAKSHALEVASDLTRNSEEYLGHRWSCWTMLVRDESGRQVFSLPLDSFGAKTNGG